jgi:hypothetical protein
MWDQRHFISMAKLIIKIGAIVMALATSIAVTIAGQINYSLELVEGSDAPLIDRSNPGSAGIQHGLEGGTVFLLKKEFHMFVSEEMTGWDGTRTGHWKSANGIQWNRLGTINDSVKTANDPRHAIWSPMPIYNPEENRWNLFYVGYEQNGTFHGRVFRAYSTVKGQDGLNGPYTDVPDALRSYADSGKHPWEGDQGADSFYPFKVGGKWLSLYGSAGTEFKWCAGLASARKLAGPWTRDTNSTATLSFAENPIITKLPDGNLFCVYDDLAHGVSDCHSIGYAYSKDGIHWTTRFLQFPMPKWATNVRTPQCFIPVGKDDYWIYFTANTASGFDCVGRLKVRCIRSKSQN